MKVIYFGTPSIAAEVLDFLIEKGVEVLAVVTKGDKPQGRSGKPTFSPVKELVTEKYPTLPLYQPDKASTPAFEEELRRYGADLFVVFAYGEIMKKDLLAIPRCGCINLHPSLLPKYRGPAPIIHALLDGAKETGVSIIEMVLKMDAGDILAQEKIAISEEMDRGELEKILVELGSETLLRVIKNYSHHVKQKVPQDEASATYVQKITPDKTKINWDQPATVLHNQIRAFSPRPGVWCTAQVEGKEKRLKIFKSLPLKDKKNSYAAGEWVIPCGEGALSILELQLEGKKRLFIDAFTRGMPKAPTLT